MKQAHLRQKPRVFVMIVNVYEEINLDLNENHHVEFSTAAVIRVLKQWYNCMTGCVARYVTHSVTHRVTDIT